LIEDGYDEESRYLTIGNITAVHDLELTAMPSLRRIGLVLALALPWSFQGATSAQEVASPVSIFWMAPARQSLSIQRSLSFSGNVTADTSTESDSRAPADTFILTGQANLDMLAKSLILASRDTRYGGIAISRHSSGALLIQNDRELPGGTIQVDQGSLGLKSLNIRSQPSADQLVELLKPLLPQ